MRQFVAIGRALQHASHDTVAQRFTESYPGDCGRLSMREFAQIHGARDADDIDADTRTLAALRVRAEQARAAGNQEPESLEQIRRDMDECLRSSARLNRRYIAASIRGAIPNAHSIRLVDDAHGLAPVAIMGPDNTRLADRYDSAHEDMFDSLNERAWLMDSSDWSDSLSSYETGRDIYEIPLADLNASSGGAAGTSDEELVALIDEADSAMNRYHDLRASADRFTAVNASSRRPNRIEPSRNEPNGTGQRFGPLSAVLSTRRHLGRLSEF